jgi:hypothetical protein
MLAIALGKPAKTGNVIASRVGQMLAIARGNPLNSKRREETEGILMYGEKATYSCSA